MKQAGLGDFENPYENHSLPDMNILRYRNVCPECGQKGAKTGEGVHENPCTGVTLHFDRTAVRPTTATKPVS
jgi:hypothetical protein